MTTVSQSSPAPRLNHRMHLLLTASQHQRLTARARTSGRSVSSLIREAIDRDLGRAPAGTLTGGASAAARRFMASGTIDGGPA